MTTDRDNGYIRVGADKEFGWISFVIALLMGVHILAGWEPIQPSWFEVGLLMFLAVLHWIWAGERIKGLEELSTLTTTEEEKDEDNV